jgi:hypothetical protein
MAFEGAGLARVMLSIHEIEMSQAARSPADTLADRIERRVVLHGGGSRTMCRVGSLLVKAGLRLQEYGSMTQQLAMRNTAIQR